MRMKAVEFGSILKETTLQWLEDEVPTRGAALSYYVLLSLGPFLVLTVGVLEFFLSPDDVRAGVVATLRDNVGPRAASTVATILERVQIPHFLALESLLTVALLLFGATAVFANVRRSLNAIWDIETADPSKREIAIDLLRARLKGFVMILLTGLVIAVSFAVTSAVSVLANVLEESLPLGWLVVRILDGTLSFIFMGVLFGAVYRTLPSTRIAWSALWVGAFATALLFVIGKSAAALLIANTSWTSYYGPGASIVAFLAWIYLSSQIFFLGAEFTQVWARRRGGGWSGASV